MGRIRERKEQVRVRTQQHITRPRQREIANLGVRAPDRKGGAVRCVLQKQCGGDADPRVKGLGQAAGQNGLAAQDAVLVNKTEADRFELLRARQNG